MDLTAELFQSICNCPTLNAEDIENLIDLAIAEIVLRSGEDLPLMGGTAGTKTVSLETAQYAAVMQAARAIYYGFYKGLETSSVSDLTVSSPDLKSNPVVDAAIEAAARRLAEFTVEYG